MRTTGLASFLLQCLLERFDIRQPVGALNHVGFGQRETDLFEMQLPARGILRIDREVDFGNVDQNRTAKRRRVVNAQAGDSQARVREVQVKASNGRGQTGVAADVPGGDAPEKRVPEKNGPSDQQQQQRQQSDEPTQEFSRLAPHQVRSMSSGRTSRHSS